MDTRRLHPISRLQSAARRDRRVQRQIHGQPDGVARLVAGDAGRSLAADLSQFLLSAGALAIQRAKAFGIPTLKHIMARPLQTALRVAPPIEAADPKFATDVLAGLTAKPKRL